MSKGTLRVHSPTWANFSPPRRGVSGEGDRVYQSSLERKAGSCLAVTLRVRINGQTKGNRLYKSYHLSTLTISVSVASTGSETTLMPLILLLSRVVEAESPYVHEFMVDIRFSIWGETLVILPIYGTTELTTLPFRRGWGTPWIFSMRNT
jgi:hypothetical protein